MTLGLAKRFCSASEKQPTRLDRPLKLPEALGSCQVPLGSSLQWSKLAKAQLSLKMLRSTGLSSGAWQCCMAWLNVQALGVLSCCRAFEASSRKPGTGDGDVLNRLHLGRVGRALASQPEGKANDAFAPPVKPRRLAKSSKPLKDLIFQVASQPWQRPSGQKPLLRLWHQVWVVTAFQPLDRAAHAALGKVWLKEEAVVLYRSSSGVNMKAVEGLERGTEPGHGEASDLREGEDPLRGWQDLVCGSGKG